MDCIIWTFSEDEINRVVCITNFIIFITRLVRWRAKMYLLQWNSLYQESILCFHCWTVLMLLAIQGLNLFPVWAITTQDETLSFTTIVNYKSNSFCLLKVYFDQTICTVPQVGKVKINYPISSKRRNWDSALVTNISKGPQLVQKKAGLTNRSVPFQGLSLSSYALLSLWPLPSRCPPPSSYFMWPNQWRKKNQTDCQIPCRHNKKLIDCNSYFPAYFAVSGEVISAVEMATHWFEGAPGAVLSTSVEPGSRVSPPV